MKKNTKRCLVIIWWLCLISLAACWWSKEISNADVVSLNCKYTFIDGTTSNIDETVIIGEDTENNWISELIIGSISWSIFTWTVSADVLFPWRYDANNTQNIPNIIMTEVIWLQNPKIGDQLFVDGFWDWYVTNEIIDENWYTSYVVDFNDPKLYSDAEYEIQVMSVEKK